MDLLQSGAERHDAARAMPRLTLQGLSVLDIALERHLAAPSPNSQSGVRHAIQRICLDARRSEWPPESLLVAFKAALNSIPAIGRLPRGPDRDAFIGPLVSLCIEEYYNGSLHCELDFATG